MSGLNFLERLLDGAAVEWKPLGELAENLDFMRKPVTSGLRDSGKIPYYGASGIVDYVKDYIFDGDFLLVSEDGANLVARNTPIAFSISGKSWVNNHAHILKFNTYAERRYIEYYLNSIDLTPYISGSAQPKLNQKNLNSIKIPNPSLAIQAEIVRILDTFTALTAELTAELGAELGDRQKQYNYYRDRLLTFEEGEVEWKPLGEVGKILRGTAITEKQTNPGDYPVVANGPSHNYFHDQSNRSGETIVIARSGVYAGLVSYWNMPIFLTDAFSIHPDSNSLSPKFLYYVLKKDQTKIHNMSKGAGVPHVRAKDFESYKVPIPPLEEQARIVAILDKFDTLTTDLSQGLPREIALRQQQYEYYRDLLLSF